MKRIKIPISIKIISATVTLIVATVGAIAINNSRQFEREFGGRERLTNRDLAKSKAVEVEGVFYKYLEKIRATSDLLVQKFSNEEERKRALDLVFGRDLDLVNIEIYVLDPDGAPKLYRRETHDEHLRQYELGKDFIDRLRRERPIAIKNVFANKDQIAIQNSTLPNAIPLLTMSVAFPDESGLVRHVAVTDIRLDRLQKGFAFNSARTLYMVDDRGAVLAHSDDRIALDGRSLASVPIVSEALAKGNERTNGERSFTDPKSKEDLIGAYYRTPFGPTVFVQVPLSTILEPARAVRNLAYEWAGYAISISLFFAFLFAYSLTSPIELLASAMRKVAQGNFEVKTQVTTLDEVEELSKGFNEMVDGLKERDKVKNMFNKFHGSSVTEDLLKGDLHLGGDLKNVTVLFSDVRDFTKFSEGHTPEEVVEMLNEYFQIMVKIITSHHGIVDKFVGDAIMAVWGAPQSSGDDPYNATLAALEMRKALAKLNEKRTARGQIPLKIGVGLHAGPVISGTIGSTERMEYTVIGDTVNMASRIESSTKAFGADLLISDEVGRHVENRLILDYAGAAEVKGKSEPIKMYKVRGTIAADGTREIIQTLYSDYEAGEADKVKVAG